MISKTKDRYDTLKEVIDYQLSTIPSLEISLKEGRTNEYFLSLTSWGFYQNFALMAYFIEHDIRLAKLYFYNCGILDELLVNKYNSKLLDAGLHNLSYALLSDEQSLITRYSHLQHRDYQLMINNGATAPLYAVQCLINEDWNEFDRVMVIVRKKSVPKLGMQLDATFYEALASKNKVLIEQVLLELLEPKMHKRRNKFSALVADFISHPALGYAKLAWIKGVEVDINHPLLPRDLLPVIPLAEYKAIDLFSIPK